MPSLEAVLTQAGACRLCRDHIEPRPVVRVSAASRLLIVGQAPGTRVHETGIPWNDPSGDRLRQWLAVDRDDFYDVSRVAVMPMGFCYPGRDKHGGDLPPRPECAPLWHGALREHLSNIQLTLLVGSYAQKYYLGDRSKKTMADTVKAWRDYLPDYLPLPHPSWRNTGWLKKNPWFEADLVPKLRKRVRALLD